VSRGLVVLLGLSATVAACRGTGAAADARGDAAATVLDATAATSPDASGPPGMADLQLVPAEMVDTVVVMSAPFRDDDCAVVEGCVGASGDRLLLRFDTVTANLGTADVRVGVPPPPGVSNDVFQWSPCHMHHHVANYARYELLDATGVVATARKQAFCLEDGEQVQPGAPPVGYSCLDQGISRGWADAYSRYLPCEWIDITGLPSGSYTLRVVVNPLHTIEESNYDNNELMIGVRF